MKTDWVYGDRVNARRDLHLTSDGRWESFDIFSGAPDSEGLNVGEHLQSQGWEHFLRLGQGDWCSLTLTAWRRPFEDRAEYLLSVSTGLAASEFLKVDNLPQLMDLVSKWAPAVQAATLADLVEDLNEPDLNEMGVLEIAAARAAWGARERLPELEADRQRMIAERRQRRRDQGSNQPRPTD
ncbi:hypothetical protein ATK30_0582 [Amycolatopsis echigonensis]|uniref:Uncharacterized protein n=1 Tax=Amycolatopsis echigonensis TaxID=2576905 RepID=A0A2N3X0F5_9PSEU|nr:hypothetical protein ATK30_0582 [Amycolatopsis niigatensis]